jgi:hypothetical protein
MMTRAWWRIAHEKKLLEVFSRRSFPFAKVLSVVWKLLGSDETVVVSSCFAGCLAFGRTDRVNGSWSSRMSIGIWNGQELAAAATTLDFLSQKAMNNTPPKTALRARKYDRHARISAQAKWWIRQGRRWACGRDRREGEG